MAAFRTQTGFVCAIWSRPIYPVGKLALYVKCQRLPVSFFPKSTRVQLAKCEDWWFCEPSISTRLVVCVVAWLAPLITFGGFYRALKKTPRSRSWPPVRRSNAIWLQHGAMSLTAAAISSLKYVILTSRDCTEEHQGRTRLLHVLSLTMQTAQPADIIHFSTGSLRNWKGHVTNH